MNNLAKITKLLKKGEKMIVLDEQAEPQFVVMDVSEYERMINNTGEDIKGLTEEELLSRINRDIAVWKSTQTDDDIEINTDDFLKNVQETENFEEEDEYYFEPVDDEED
jgi:PHD/YefM family antitoxin component YafN of YafNO toxin-antitoxin module